MFGKKKKKKKGALGRRKRRKTESRERGTRRRARDEEDRDDERDDEGDDEGQQLPNVPPPEQRKVTARDVRRWLVDRMEGNPEELTDDAVLLCYMAARLLVASLRSGTPSHTVLTQAAARFREVIDARVASGEAEMDANVVAAVRVLDGKVRVDAQQARSRRRPASARPRPATERPPPEPKPDEDAPAPSDEPDAPLPAADVIDAEATEKKAEPERKTEVVKQDG